MLEMSKRPQWQTVQGGSQTYVRAFRKAFPGEVKIGCSARSIRRTDDGVILSREGAESERFDAVVIATHADEALALLEDPSQEEVSALSSWRYSKNRTVLHTDPAVLGPRRRLWAAWNYRRRTDSRPDSPVAITYYMNRLQRLKAHNDYFVTLNCGDRIDPQKVIYEVEYTHPVYTPKSPVSQSAIRALNGTRRTYFCGAYMRYGFHEDAVISALEVAAKFGLAL
jgi:predicted NAD/FAD-binding protein